MEARRHGWHEYRDELYHRLVDALVADYVNEIRHSRVYGYDTTPRTLSAEIEVGSGLIVVRWCAGREARADAYGKEVYLPLLSTWLSDMLSRYGMHRVANEAWNIIDESDREDRAYMETERALMDNRIWF